MMNRKFGKRMTAALFAVLMVLSLAACGPKEQTPAESGSNPVDGSAVQTMDTLTMDVFKDYDLTLVNLFTTWCTPCVREIPELDLLDKQMADKKVNVIGVGLDTVDAVGNPAPDLVTTALELKFKTGAEYDFYIPDLELFGGRMKQVTAVPETFFVDSEGNIVGNTWMGARDLSAWTAIVEETLASMESK